MYLLGIGNMVCQNVTGHNGAIARRLDDCSLEMLGVNMSKVILPSQLEIGSYQLGYRLYSPEIGPCSHHGSYQAIYLSCVIGKLTSYKLFILHSVYRVAQVRLRETQIGS